MDSVSAGLSAPTTSAVGIAAATLSPAASYEIGQYFKGKDAEGSAAHILAHTVLGAAVAAAGGNDALSAGLAAGGAEAAAPVLSHYLYGKDAKNLTADEKSTISAITGLVASGVGASTGDIGSTVQSGQAAQNAVEENYQTRQTLAIINKKLQACTPSDRTCITKAVLDLRAADKTLDDALNLCAQTGNSACVEAHLKNILSSDSSAEMKEMALQLQRLKIATEVSGALNETNNLGAGTARQIEFLRYAQRQCQGITYGACGSQYNKLQLSAAQKVLIPAKSAVKDYIVGEKPRTGASYYIAGVGYVAAELLLPESGTDLALTAVGAGAVKGASLASREAKAAEAVRQKQVVENNFNAENVGYGNAAIRDFQPGKTHRAENINAGQVTDRDGLVRVDERSVSKTPKTLNDQQVNAGRYPTGYPAWKPGTTDVC
ncbi:VENN motif pre-toxin domain-containing protein [Alkanindiges illinoisensis]|uniref:VENN motif pre-toxin domain-containing protein n=1 Tax=Alkanindiges illinoisensis TaxID=197183 RepID=UPI003D362BE3